MNRTHLLDNLIFFRMLFNEYGGQYTMKPNRAKVFGALTVLLGIAWSYLYTVPLLGEMGKDTAIMIAGAVGIVAVCTFWGFTYWLLCFDWSNYPRLWSLARALFVLGGIGGLLCAFMGNHVHTPPQAQLLLSCGQVLVGGFFIVRGIYALQCSSDVFDRYASSN